MRGEESGDKARASGIEQGVHACSLVPSWDESRIRGPGVMINFYLLCDNFMITVFLLKIRHENNIALASPNFYIQHSIPVYSIYA